MNGTPRFLPIATRYQFLQRKEKGTEVHKIKGMLVVIEKKKENSNKKLQTYFGWKGKVKRKKDKDWKHGTIWSLSPLNIVQNHGDESSPWALPMERVKGNEQLKWTAPALLEITCILTDTGEMRSLTETSGVGPGPL